MYKRNDLTGMAFGNLTVLKESGRTKDRHIMYECKCTCGNNTVVSGRDLKSGHTKSCGCNQGVRHGGRRIQHTDRLYFVWRGMMARCNTKSATGYKDYGGRGIKVCKEWHDYAVFKKWAYQNGYDETAKRFKCTIDRINVNGNYEPDNCRFVGMDVQCRNKRNSKIGGADNG